MRNQRNGSLRAPATGRAPWGRCALHCCGIGQDHSSTKPCKRPDLLTRSGCCAGLRCEVDCPDRAASGREAGPPRLSWRPGRALARSRSMSRRVRARARPVRRSPGALILNTAHEASCWPRAGLPRRLYVASPAQSPGHPNHHLQPRCRCCTHM